MATIGPKEAQLREMRERQYAERQAVLKPVAKQAKLKTAKAAVKSHVVIETLSLVETDAETLTVEKLSVSCAGCGEDFQPKRSTAKFCSSACRLKAHRGK